MIRIVTIGALLLATPVLAQTLKPGTGEDVAEANCGACHAVQYIPMNSPFLTPDGWKAEVTKMRAAFGAPFDDAVSAEIQQYLNANYGAKP